MPENLNGQRFKIMSHSMMALMVVAVGITAAAVYLPTLGADFVYDDTFQIVVDDYIHKAANLGEVLSFRVLQRDVLDRNRPMMLLSLMLDSLLWGRNPLGYHLSNLLLHVLCTVLLFLLLLDIFRRLIGSEGRTNRPFLGALFGAMLFAVHPANTEAVCVVSFREDILVALFTLAGFSIAQRFPAQRKLTTVLLGIGCALSMLAAVAGKESGAVAPLLLLIYWLVVRQRTQPRTWIALIAIVFAVTAGFLVARFACEPEHSVIFTEKPTYPAGSFSSTMLRIQPRIWAYQLGVLFWPGLLCADKTSYTIRNVNLTVALLILVITVVGTFILARRNWAVGLGAAFYWLALLPVSNLAPMYRPMADRYLYFPMIGVCLAGGAIVCRLKISSKRWARALLIGAAAVFVVLGVFTVRQTFLWQNERSLWEATIKKNPQSVAANKNLGFVLFDDGEFDRAVQLFKRACGLSPRYASPWGGLAITYDALQKPALAEQALRQAAARDKRYTDPARLVEGLIWEPRHADKLQIIADRTFKH